ncbi:unnamed protein product, partial [Musa textilis]
LISDAGKELYLGCSSFSKLFIFIVRLFHLKCFYGCSNKLFNVIFELLNLALPLGVGLPKSTYETKKFIGDLGLGYRKFMLVLIMVYCSTRKQKKKNDESCCKCGACRWELNQRCVDNNAKNKWKKQPSKVVRYFQLIP